MNLDNTCPPPLIYFDKLLLFGKEEDCSQAPDAIIMWPWTWWAYIGVIKQPHVIVVPAKAANVTEVPCDSVSNGDVSEVLVCWGVHALWRNGTEIAVALIASRKRCDSGNSETLRFFPRPIPFSGIFLGFLCDIFCGFFLRCFCNVVCDFLAIFLQFPQQSLRCCTLRCWKTQRVFCDAIGLGR